MIKPPPIAEPWRLDDKGRLASPAWVQWLQALIGVDAHGNISAGSTPITNIIVSGNPVAPDIPPKIVTHLDSPYTILISDGDILADASAGPVSVVLPVPPSHEGHVFTVKKIDHTSNVVSISVIGGFLIDDDVVQSIDGQFVSLSAVANGGQYYII